MKKDVLGEILSETVDLFLGKNNYIANTFETSYTGHLQG